VGAALRASSAPLSLSAYGYGAWAPRLGAAAAAAAAGAGGGSVAELNALDDMAAVLRRRGVAAAVRAASPERQRAASPHRRY
jgi:hypothetical protein